MIQKLRNPRLLASAIVAAVTMAAVVVSVLVLANVVARNCEQIELLKAQIRPDPFSLAETQMLLRDLGIDPESEQGQRLIALGRMRNLAEREELAPHDC